MKYSVPVRGFRDGEIFYIVKRQITRAFVRATARLFETDAVLVFCSRASAAKRHPHPRDLDLRSKLVFSKDCIDAFIRPCERSCGRTHSAEAWVSMIRAIKCLKGIWWMPWR